MRRWIPVLVLLAAFSSTAEPTRSTPTTVVEQTGWEELDPGPLAPREGAALVWTGDELVVWGGPRQQSDEDGYADGAAYDPDVATWRPMSAAPLPGGSAVGVWTGDEVLLWSVGGERDRFGLPRPTDRWEGAAWDPSTDTWRSLRRSPAVPTDGGYPAPVWTGEEAVDLSIGRAYDPAADRWRPLPPLDVEGGVEATVWTGEEVLGLVAQPQVPLGNAVVIAYDPAADALRQLPDTGVGDNGVDLTWDGEQAVLLDYLMRGATYEPGADEWTPLPRLALRTYECSPTLVPIADTVLAAHCAGNAVLTDDRRWALSTTAPEGTGRLIEADDTVLSWWSTDEDYNFPDAPITDFRRYEPPRLADDDLAAERTIPVGTVLLDLPEGARLTNAGLHEEAGGLVEVITYELADPDCTLTSTYAGSVGLSARRIRNEVSAVEADLSRIELPGVDIDRNQGLVARVEAGELDAQAHVLLEQTTSDVLDIVCADLATAEGLLDRVHR